MSDITPEMLKVVAEGMGYRKSRITWNSDIYVAVEHKTSNRDIEYNPLTNTEQCMEIMEKLNIQLRRQTHKPNGLWVARIEYVVNQMIVKEGETINEAVCLAAYSHFKEGDE